ncbi:LacI family DNA-binding transcriptional regulator [Mucilaginibacter jinjuensis]|uniref:Substrate-binding domain-containing protein n=1 Tax=Mucilaginibacter jinjuensis TaxID=1176721 RepID=A0ABY7TDD9_9SPHI|nr:substrate-binding domain-containing protein [Mucilaginibacter jinjuensis]WCT14169.1 substrate-binding domain-containing protein [Mucilaginibacter jinjuensis]
MKKKISMNDIARELNISLTTVSFILNGKAKEMRISDKLADRVLDFVKERNYNPNSMAQGLRTGKSKIIGLIVEDIADAFFSGVARHIEEHAYKNGYKIIYCSTEDKPAKTVDLIQMFKSRNVDGYIITPPKGIENEVKALLNEKLPVVLFDRYLPDVAADYVVLNNQKGVKMAVDHLVEQGYQNIGFITLDSTQTQMAARLVGYSESVKEAGLKEHILKVNFTTDTESIVDSISNFLQYSKNIDALMFATNYLTLQGFEALNRQNLKIAEDIGVVSFDDHTFFKVFNPPITAVSQPLKQLSETVIDTLFKSINEENVTGIHHQIVLEPELIVRKSSLRLKSAERILTE